MQVTAEMMREMARLKFFLLEHGWGKNEWTHVVMESTPDGNVKLAKFMFKAQAEQFLKSIRDHFAATGEAPPRE